MPPRVANAGVAFWEKCLSRYEAPSQPLLWRVFEADMAQAKQGTECLIPDDRDPSKAWVAQPLELAAYLLLQVLQDPQWRVRMDLDADSVLTWLYARAELGLPSFLKRLLRPKGGRSIGHPAMFAFVKSKCYDNQGRRTCRKEGHSCCRRVIDMATVPYSKAWKVVARGLRGVVQASGVSRELFDLKLAVPEFRKMLASVDWSNGP